MIPITPSIPTSCFLSLPEGIFPLTLRGLDLKSFIQFEAASSCHYQLTKDQWVTKRKAKNFQFNWSFLSDHPQVDKWSYILSKLLFDHVDLVKKLSKMQDQEKKRALIEKTQGQWNYLIKQFPLWGYYIEDNLAQVSPHLIRREITKVPYHKVVEEKWGGDLLLQGLFEAKQLSFASSLHEIERVFAYFEKAIHRQASCASFLALSFLSLLNPAHVKWKGNLISLAEVAANQEDYRAIEVLQSACPKTQFTFKKGMKFAQRQAELGNKYLRERKLEWADVRYKEALEGYAKQVPFWLLVRAAYVKQGLEHFREADSLYTQALERYKDQVTGDVLEKAAYVKRSLKQYGEADRLYAQALDKLGDQASISVLSQAATLKACLGQLEAADLLFRRLLEKDKENIPDWIVMLADRTKQELNKTKPDPNQ